MWPMCIPLKYVAPTTSIPRSSKLNQSNLIHLSYDGFTGGQESKWKFASVHRLVKPSKENDSTSVFKQYHDGANFSAFYIKIASRLALLF